LPSFRKTREGRRGIASRQSSSTRSNFEKSAGSSFPPGAGERYRAHPAGAGPVDSYVWVADGTRQPETVAWSRVRYDGYAFLAVDVVPARPGRPTTMTLRTLADALPGRPGPYTEIDRVTLRRVAGASRIS